MRLTTTTNLLAIISLGALTSAADAGRRLTYADLLAHLTDLDRLPVIEPGVACRQFSSYDRQSRVDEATGALIDWEANGDAGKYLRIDPETKEGVMAEMEGPGCIFRIWSANPQGTIRFYLDGDTKPTFETDFSGLFRSHTPPFIPPFVWARDPKSHESASDCYLPIPFARSCRITTVGIDKKGNPYTPGHYYIIDYRTFPRDWEVESFKLPLSDADRRALDEAGRLWASPPLPGDVLLGTKELQPGQSHVLLERSGAGVIRAFYAKIRSVEKWATRKVLLRAYWDGQERPAIDCPIGDFFGEPKDVPYRSYPMGITETFNYCRFPMPFRQSARIVIVNEGKEPVQVMASLADEKREIPEDWARFHARYRQEKESTSFDYPLLEAAGTGKLVGIALFPDNIHGGWWGEGDEKVWVDGEKFPSWYGTGSEDYFGDAWGIQHFVNPSHGHPQKRVERMQGCYRWHLGDNIPFYRSIRMTIENYAGLPREKTKNDYYSVAYWYQLPGGSDFFTGTAAADRVPRGYVVPDALEAEDHVAGEQKNLAIVDDEKLPQELSRGRGVKLSGRAGDTFTFNLPADSDDRYRITVHPLRGEEGHAFEMLADGRKVDKWAHLRKGDNPVVIRLLGKAGEPCAVTLDCFQLTVFKNLITDWVVIGPFASPGGKGLDIAYPPEKQVDPKARYAGRDQEQIGWQKLSHPSGRILMNDLLDPRDNCVVYGACVVEPPRAGRYTLLLGSDDGVKVWINGKEVWRNPQQRSLQPDSDKVEVSLEAGPNLLLVKVQQGMGDVGWAVRFLDPEDRFTYSLPR